MNIYIHCLFSWKESVILISICLIVFAVQALERAKSMGTVDNVEELLMVVAERVKEKQRQNHQVQFQKNNNAVQVCLL